LTLKCSRCRRGKLFTHRGTNLNHMTDMPTHCSHCGLKFEREPGFFWGSMYITYAFSVGLFLMVLITLMTVFNDPPTWVYLSLIGGLSILTLPWQVRYARAIMLYLFSDVKFDRERASSPPVDAPDPD